MPRKKDFKVAVQGADRLFSANDTTVSAPSEALTELKTNQTFKVLIPPLSEDEYLQLEENLLEHGIREPISIWDGTIVDGHNRYELAKKHNLPFATVNYGFKSEGDAILWIINNQFGRRNLSSWHRSVLALKLKPIIAKKAKERQSAAGGALLQNSVKAVGTDLSPAHAENEATAEPLLQNSVKAVGTDLSSAHAENEAATEPLLQNSVKAVGAPIHTQREIAGIAGVSHDTIARVEKIIQAGNPEMIGKLENREMSINEAFREIRSFNESHREPPFMKRKPETAAPAARSAPVVEVDGMFNVIYVNPAWEANFPDDEMPTGYSPVRIGDIKNMQIPTEDDAVLFLWTSSPGLEKALRLMGALGFKYRTNLIWDKTETGLLQFVRGQHDVLLIGIKGKFALPADDVRISSVYREELNNHLKKPTWFYEQIEKLYPNGKYLELFSAQQFNARWTVWEPQVKAEEAESK